MGAPALSVRVVCDTNVVVSALVFTQGRLGWLREAWRSGRAVPLVSRETVAELLRVLHYPKFELTSRERQELLGDYLPFAEIVDPRDTQPEVPLCKDPDDRMFLELAVAGEADLLISGDPDLLELSDAFPIPRVSPAEARLRLERGNASR